MRVQSGPYFALALVLSALLLFTVIDRILFLARSGQVTGMVAKLHGENEDCGLGRRRVLRQPRPCTKFWAEVRYLVGEHSYAVELAAGESRGHDQPVSLARYRVGDSVPILYRVASPGWGERKELLDLWSLPLLVFMFQALSLGYAFRRRRRR